MKMKSLPYLVAGCSALAGALIWLRPPIWVSLFSVGGASIATGSILYSESKKNSKSKSKNVKKTDVIQASNNNVNNETKQSQSNESQNNKSIPLNEDTPQNSTPQVLDVGSKINNMYTIESKLGEGGFGMAFIVVDETKKASTKYVAKLQKLSDDNDVNSELIERFEREASALERLGSSHGQIPTLFDFFEFDSNFFLIQELIQGVTLMDVFLMFANEKHLAPISFIYEITISLLEVVEFIHQQGMIHRDIKPQNIILREGDRKPILIDFGLVKAFDENNWFKTGTQAGTIGFMPPEQMLGKALYQSDLYAIGMVFLLLATGCPPHKLEFDDSMNFKLDWVEDYMSSDLANWLRKAIAPLPQNRYSSASEMRNSLLAIRDSQIRDDGYRQAIDDISSLADQEAQKSGRSLKVNVSSILAEKGGGQIPVKLQNIVTTQVEVDGFNVVKRLVERSGLDSSILEMTDYPDYCDIHYRSSPKQVIIRFYFNDEANLKFSVFSSNGEGNLYDIQTLRGIPPKKSKIMARIKEIEASLNIERSSYSTDSLGDLSADNDLVVRELMPIISNTISEYIGNKFNILSITIQEDPLVAFGQVNSTDIDITFNYEICIDLSGDNQKASLTVIPEHSQRYQNYLNSRQDEEEALASRGIYTVGWLQRNFSTLRQAKEHFGVKAKSWEALAKRLSERAH